jgi:CheY-like chemotaxis protein
MLFVRRPVVREMDERMPEPARTIVIIGDGVYALSLAELLRLRGQCAVALDSERRSHERIASLSPRALIVDLMVARRDDFALLRQLQADSSLSGVPVLVSSPGTVTGDDGRLEAQLRALGARPLLDSHELEAVIAELAALNPKVA